MTMATNQRKCRLCKEPAELVCQRCRDPYCSNKCQVDDWPLHKEVCFPMPSLVKPIDSGAVLLQKLQADLHATLSARPLSQIAPMRKPKVAANFANSTERIPTDNDTELKKGGSMFDNPFNRNKYYPGFQTNDPLDMDENSQSSYSLKGVHNDDPYDSKNVRIIHYTSCNDAPIGNRKPEISVQISQKTATKSEPHRIPMIKREIIAEQASQMVDSKSKLLDSTTNSTEIRPIDPEIRPITPDVPITKLKPLEMEPKQREMEPKPCELEPKTREMERKKREFESKPCEMEPKPREIEPKAREMELKPREIESKPCEIESKPREIEPKPREMEMKLRQMESKPRETEPKPREIEPKLREKESNVFEMKSPPKQQSKPIEMESKTLEVKLPPKQVTESWMKPFPIEGNAFVPVVVQYAPEGNTQTAWVMLQKNETGSNNLLREVNKNISAVPNVRLSEITVNQLYRVPFEEIYYRGMTLAPIDSIGFVLVRLIDYGNEVNVPIDLLKPVIPVMKNLNAFAVQIKFQTPREVAIGDVLSIRIKSVNDDNVMSVLVEGETSFFTMDDLEIIPIPVGVKTNLYCLDFSNVQKGYVSASVYDAKAIGLIEEMGAKMSAYCGRSKGPYQPHVNELCLAVYEDGEWYRAVTLKVIDSNMFGIMFIDYGNITTVSSSNIRKMPEEFLHHCLTNTCFVAGAPKKPSKDDIEKMALYFDENRIFPIEAAEKEKGVYLINIHDLKW